MKVIYIVGKTEKSFVVNVFEKLQERLINECYGAILPFVFMDKYKKDPNYEIVEVKP